MSKILFLLPDQQMMSQAQAVLAATYPDLLFANAPPGQAVETARLFIAKGINIIAARAGSARALSDAELGITVVHIPVTTFDILRAVNDAKLQSKRIAVVAVSSLVLGIDFFADILNVNIQRYAVNYGHDYTKTIRQAVADGAEVILTGIAGVKAAKAFGIPAVLIGLGAESLLQAAQEATKIREALELEASKRSFLRAILEQSHEGIITIDHDTRITAFNPMAQKITGVNAANALGQLLKKTLPQIDWRKSPAKDLLSPHHIIGVKDTKVLCASSPITINGKHFGAVITLQETSKIEEMESYIRKEAYTRGHTAKFNFHDIIGKSPAILDAIAIAKDFAATNSSILILGETGTGKEVFAQSIHNASNRACGPFVAINCAALPAHLLESELFGYVSGAFTGASKEGKAGLFEIAHGGTIFLDELAEMDYVNQSRLLRVLQEKVVVHLGSSKVIPVDVRIIAATNKELESMVREHRFRDDLYYRLNVLRLELPPLRARKADIPLYASAFLHEFSAGSGKKFLLNQDALQLLREYSWPGNIRECRNIMERIAAIAKTEVITDTMIRNICLPKHPEPLPALPQTPPPAPPIKDARIIKKIISALEAADGNQTAAAELLNISRITLWRRMQKYNIQY